MMHTFCKYSDETEVVFSDIRIDENGKETIWISFERPTEQGFDTVIFELPTYKIIKKEGKYSEEELSNFKTIVERGAPSFFRWAREGGIKIA